MGYHSNAGNKFLDHYKTNISFEGKNEPKIEYKKVFRHVCLDCCKIQNTTISTADRCKNCAKCGKGFKIGPNEACNIKIKIRLRGISKIFCFCSHSNMAASDKGISLKRKFFKKFLLNFTN